MKKKTAKHIVKILKEIQKLNNKSFDKMLNKGTHNNKAGLRNSRIDDHVEDLLGILQDDYDKLS